MKCHLIDTINKVYTLTDYKYYFRLITSHNNHQLILKYQIFLTPMNMKYDIILYYTCKLSLHISDGWGFDQIRSQQCYDNWNDLQQ